MPADSWGERAAWRKFERIVAALHKFRDAGATVTWNEHLEGRQVDVTVRFERGGYSYLVLIECKNYKDAVPVKEVEAFVTKSNDLRADKAVMVAAAGFQSGAVTVAQRHKIELYTLTEITDRWPSQVISTREPGIQLYDVRIWPSFGVAPIDFPNEPADLAALRFDPPNWPPGLSLGDVARQAKDLTVETLDQPREFQLNFRKGCAVRHARLPSGAVSIDALRFMAKRTLVWVARPVIPPDLPLLTYEYENVLTGAATKIAASDLPIGLDNTFRPGTFYRDVFGITSRCEQVNGDDVQMFVMMHQHGKPVAARVVMDRKDASQYVEVTDLQDVARLEAEYQTYVKRGASQP